MPSPASTAPWASSASLNTSRPLTSTSRSWSSRLNSQGISRPLARRWTMHAWPCRSWAGRNAVLREVAGRGHHHLPFRRPDRYCDHAARQRFAEADAGIEAFGHQIGQRRLHAQLHVHLRIARQERRQCRQHPALGHDAWKGDAQLPGRNRTRAVEVGERRIDLLQSAAYTFRKRAPCSVRPTRRVVRCSRRTPIRASSARTLCDSAEVEMPSASAARVKLAWSAT